MHQACTGEPVSRVCWWSSAARTATPAASAANTNKLQHLPLSKYGQTDYCAKFLHILIHTGGLVVVKFVVLDFWWMSAQALCATIFCQFFFSIKKIEHCQLVAVIFFLFLPPPNDHILCTNIILKKPYLWDHVHVWQGLLLSVWTILIYCLIGVVRSGVERRVRYNTCWRN